MLSLAWLLQARSEVEAAAVAKEGDDSERSALVLALLKVLHAQRARAVGHAERGIEGRALPGPCQAARCRDA